MTPIPDHWRRAFGAAPVPPRRSPERVVRKRLQRLERRAARQRAIENGLGR